MLQHARDLVVWGWFLLGWPVQRFYKSVIVQFLGDLSHQSWVIGRMGDRQCLPGKLDRGMLLPCDMVGNGEGPEG